MKIQTPYLDAGERQIREVYVTALEVQKLVEAGFMIREDGFVDWDWSWSMSDDSSYVGQQRLKENEAKEKYLEDHGFIGLPVIVDSMNVAGHQVDVYGKNHSYYGLKNG